MQGLKQGQGLDHKDQDKDLTHKDQDKDLTPNDQEKDKDKDLKYVLKESLRTRTRINITGLSFLVVTGLGAPLSSSVLKRCYISLQNE